MVSVQGFPSGEDRSFNVVKLRIISDKKWTYLAYLVSNEIPLFIVNTF